MRRPHRDEMDWHVFSRGARRLDLFHEEGDFLKFLSILKWAVEVSGGALLAYCLMSNHYHLVVRATSEQLTALMRRLNSTYSLYHNEKYKLVGHAFDGPYQAFPQKSPLLMLRTIAYVFLNPVQAGMVSRPEDYRWSCYRDYLGLHGTPLPVNPFVALRTVDEDLVEARRRFRQVMEEEARRPKRPHQGVPTALAVAQQQFQWLREYARQRKADLEGERPTVVAMHWARQCGVPPRAMAAAMGDASIGQVRQTLWRFTEKLRGSPELSRRLVCP